MKRFSLIFSIVMIAFVAIGQQTQINTGVLLKPGSNSTFFLTNGSGSVVSGNLATLVSGGTGISVSGNTVTNTAPDQTVSFSGAGITGTYPSFTIDGELSGLSALTGTGFPAMTGAGAFTNRSLAIGTDASGLTGTWTNPAGVAGNPTLAIETGALAWKRAVRVVSTSNITLSGTQSIDGVSLSAGERVLVAGQTTASANGVYLVAAGAWSRAGDSDAASEFEGQAVYVREGTAKAGSVYVLSTTGAITVGSTSLTYVQFKTLSAAGSGSNYTIDLSGAGGSVGIIAGSGITISRSGNDLTIAASASAPTLTISRFEDVPGSNTTTTNVSGFTPLTTDTMVFLDGVMMDWGATEDITVSGTTITFNFTVLAGQKIIVKKFAVN